MPVEDEPGVPEAPAGEPVAAAPSKRGGVPPPLDDSDRQLAAVSYILTWITGLLVLLLADKEKRYARWHAIQAIGFGIVVVVVLGVLGVVQAILALLFSLGTAGDLRIGFDLFFFPGPWLGAGIAGVGNLLVLVLVVILAVKAYQDDTVRIPLVCDIADEHA